MNELAKANGGDMMEKYIEGLVSVVIPTYKQSKLLHRAIDSILNKTYRKIEILVVNDNEPEDEFTEKVKIVISSIKDDRLKLVLQDRHINSAAARNAGIRAACGGYVAFLDDDDYWHKLKIEKQVEMLS